MKRYIVFGGERFYPQGGWEDYLMSYDTIEEAVAYVEGLAKNDSDMWSHVLDTKHWEIACDRKTPKQMA